MNPKSFWAPWLIGVLFLAAILPTLNATRLVEVDELIYARVAQEATRDGHWMPLSWAGKPWLEKPPLLIWAAAATAKLSGAGLEAWPYRLWCCLGAALCVVALLRLALIAGLGPWAAALAGLLFALQGDVLFHARFFSMDLALLACVLWALVACASGAWRRAGICMALGVGIKSWFVLGFFPGFAFALWRNEESPKRERALAWVLGVPLAALVGVTLLYRLAYGESFFHMEFIGNLYGRFQGLVNERIEDNLSYYGKWALRTAAALIPLALAAPAAVLLRSWPKGAPRLVAEFSSALALSWILALCLIKAQVINYLLPLEAAVCLCWALALGGEESAPAAWTMALLAALSLASARRLLSVEASLLLSAGAALAFFALRRVEAASSAAARALGLAFTACLLVLLSSSAYEYLRHPDDPSREVAEVMLAHPARSPGESLFLLGQNTQAIAFYSRYNVIPLAAAPLRRPQEAVLAHTTNGWVFYPPLK